MLVARETTLIECKILKRDEKVPVDHRHKEALELVDVLQGHAAHRRYVLVRVVSVVVHLRGHEHCREDQSEKKRNVIHWQITGRSGAAGQKFSSPQKSTVVPSRIEPPHGLAKPSAAVLMSK